MISLESIVHFANNYLQIYSLVDIVEITFFIIATFKISSWLNKDYTKPLLLYFYSYFAILFCSFFFQLTTVYHLMLVTAPIYFVLLVVHHQKNLQKNFILSKNKPLTPAKVIHKEWLETLIRSCLIASHHKKNVTCVIEQSDSLESLINKPFTIDIPIQKHIIDMLLESISYNDTKLILVDRHGTIMSINASWSDLVINECIFNQVSEQQLPKEYAKIITAKTDAILIHINSEIQHNFIGHQGRIVENMTVDQALKLMKNLLHKKDTETSLLKGINLDQSKSASFSSFYKD
ncbi:hypothetical protein [Candidatus Chromulinivorax destructor]|uniref:DAC domain-containing protein n=1 Tax=Candidatus Chromulinivorax destructor TaxID=2066483 RepID=A0A345ZB26_9BACT|nr:hypothetical protein [Candidatus Chromulinivorax destructor]AXK60493.1 hypothetical protein C0J27_01880 [Candidatus Chromulinivorax destructor]